jgi:hypothetical protein
VPPSLNTDAWHPVDFQNEQTPELKPHVRTTPAFTPYLSLQARLSQLWFNRWTVLILLVLVRLLILLGSLNDNIGDAKVKALSACTKVEDIGSAMASMPHYLSVGVNALAADGITKAVSGMTQVLMMILTGVEALILFVINMYIGTYACLAAALIHGGLDVSIGVVEGATKVFNDAIGTITGDISSAIASTEKEINDVTSKISGMLSGLGITIPTINIDGDLNNLKNIKVNSSDLVKDLVALNTTIPTFDQVENFTKSAISIPFDYVKQQVNSSLGGYAFDQSVFPVAQKQALSFCSNNSFLNDFFTSLFDALHTAKIVACVLLPFLAVLAMAPMWWLEIRRWRKEKARAKLIQEKINDPMDVVYVASRPYTANFGIYLGGKFKKVKNQILVRWLIAYGTSLPALFILSLAVAGLLSCACQAMVLNAIQKQAPALATEVGDFAGDVVQTLQKVSTDWANDANGVILKVQGDINDDVLGWVVNATTAVNNTLNTFDDDIGKAITDVFNNTVLLNTARDLVGCLVTRKIETVEKGLTWVHDNAHVTLPLFSNDIFSQGANASVTGDSNLTSFLASPSSVTTDEITSAVDSVITRLRHGIVQEALISLALLLIYIIAVLLGVVRALVGAAQREKTRAEGGESYLYRAPALSVRDEGSIDTRSEPSFEKTHGDLVYAGSVKRGRPSPPTYPSHARKSSHPDVEDYMYSGR